MHSTPAQNAVVLGPIPPPAFDPSSRPPPAPRIVYGRSWKLLDAILLYILARVPLILEPGRHPTAPRPARYRAVVSSLHPGCVVPRVHIVAREWRWRNLLPAVFVTVLSATAAWSQTTEKDAHR